MTDSPAPQPAAAPTADPFQETPAARSASPSVSPPPTTNAGPPTVDPSTRPTSNTPEAQRESPVDPRVVALRGMFPDYDDAILQSVLESVNGNEDRAIDALLLMSDPDYRSDAPTQPEVHAPPISQTDLDEQFARQLVLEEQHLQQATWMAANPNAPTAYRPYQRPHGWQPSTAQPQPQSASAQGTGEFQEQFSKIAETGKKTFGSLFSKVKAKIQEFERGGTSAAPSGPQQSWSPPAGIPPAQPQAYQQPAYYDPNMSAQAAPPMSPSPPAPVRVPAVQGYDVGSTTPPPTSTSPPRTTTTTQLQREPTPSATALDAGKLGLLPKKTVSLLRPDAGAPVAVSEPSPISTSTSTASAEAPAAPSSVAAGKKPARQETDDSLEYTENPFEEFGSSK